MTIIPMISDIFLKKSKVCCISDIHLGVHQNSSVWHDISLNWSRWLRDELKSHGIEDIIISGDFFHYRDQISVNTLHLAYNILDIWKDFNVIMVVGNHDAYYKDRCDVNSLSILSHNTNITVVSNPKTTTLFNRTVTFCPWNTDVTKIPESDIIFGHFEIQTFKKTAFKVCTEGVSVKALLSKGKMIVTGHFHLREERLYDEKNIVYLGNPYQMDFGDTGNVKGYYLLDFDTLKYEFYRNTTSPTHHIISLSDLVSQKRLTKDVTSTITNNFIRFVIDRNITSDDIDIVVKKLTTYKPAALTIDHKSNKSVVPIDIENVPEMSSLDIPTAIEEFVSLMEIDGKKEITTQAIDLYKKCKL